MTTWAKLSNTIEEQDLFAVPVQVTYRGKRAFGTFFGGCISIILILSLSIYFFYELYGQITEPTFK